jgi:hypothetical protein
MKLDYIPEEMISKFFEKSGETYLTGEYFECDTEKGFMTFAIAPDCVFAHNVFGEGKYWEDRAVEIAKAKGVNKVKTVMSKALYDKLQDRYSDLKITGYLLVKEV